MSETADSPARPPSTPPLVSVRGEIVLEVEPEIAQLTVYVHARDRDRRRALERLTERNRECLDLVKGYGDAVEQIETSGLAISPIMRDKRRDEKVDRYQGTVHTTITVADFSVLGELVTRLGELELVSVHGPWWALRRDSDVYRQAAQQAVRAAVARARDYADALGCRLTGLVQLSDEGLSTDGGAREQVFGMVAASAAPTESGALPAIDLEPQKQVVRTAVEARFTTTAPEL
ncbi:SIMPL domain-containing protein [Actinomadura sp. HBU206391]|uniref:SIMPL domain-containing protein n=1 Tax=Actinomadura sp. HBU206391 TaxID=2731692 RepID=UPI0016502BB3|nr:SIMPL domain-containing protein [Actinomadura sp. HBU206391]MBC6460441.1 SIMPL domain-containing protein [Actinomadura sp. HBU206391]